MNNTTPLLTQVRTAYFSADCGMAYIMRTADGKFVLIDSNWGEYEEPEHLLEILSAQNTREGKPVIAAWFFTHAHPDHYLGFVRLCDRHPDEFTVEKIIYNFPFEGRCPGSGTPQSFADAVASRTEGCWRDFCGKCLFWSARLCLGDCEGERTISNAEVSFPLALPLIP